MFILVTGMMERERRDSKDPRILFLPSKERFDGIIIVKEEWTINNYYGAGIRSMYFPQFKYYLTNIKNSNF